MTGMKIMIPPREANTAKVSTRSPARTRAALETRKMMVRNQCGVPSLGLTLARALGNRPSSVITIRLLVPQR